MNISFDFDGTLQTYDGKPIQRVIDIAKNFIDSGENVSVVTKRNKKDLPEVKKFVKENIGNTPVISTDGQWKWKTLQDQNIDIHFDDDPNEISLIKKNTGIQTMLVDDDQSPERLDKIKPMEYIDKSVLVFDGGTLVSVAERLTKDFGTVYYYGNYKKDYNKTSDLVVGEGFNFEWVLDLWNIIDTEKPDLFIFTGVGDGDLQEHLRSLGYFVWGSGSYEKLEIFKGYFVDWLKENDMPYPPTVKVKGITELRNELYKSKDHKFVKLDANERGVIETFEYKGDEEATELTIMTPIVRELGGAAETVEFVIQDPIDAKIEDGYDGFMVNGQFPSISIMGIEKKDAAYAGKKTNYEDLPEGVKYVNDKLSKSMPEYKGQISTEIREGDKPYFIDPTLRFPYPPTNCILDNWINMATCLYEGARGNLVDPIYECDYVVELIIYSDYAKDDDFKLIFPEEYAEYIKHPYSYKNENGSIITIKQENTGNTNVASVVYRDNDLQTAIDKCIEIANELEGYGLKFDIEALKEAGSDLEGEIKDDVIYEKTKSALMDEVKRGFPDTDHPLYKSFENNIDEFAKSKSKKAAKEMNKGDRKKLMSKYNKTLETEKQTAYYTAKNAFKIKK